jgi:long-chain acyl-CoA synthetase
MSQRPWLATYQANRIPAEIDPGTHASIVSLLEAAMQQFAAKPAFHAFGRSLSYAEVDTLSAAFCAWLQARGVRKGDRVALMAPNLMAFPVVTLGILRAGAIQVNVNPLYTPRELEHQLNDSGCETIVVYAGSTPALAEVVNHTGVRTVVSVATGDCCGTTLPTPAVDARLSGHIPLAEALQLGMCLTLQPMDISGEDLAFLQYTGGTTGLSKGAALSHRNLVANTEQFKAIVADALRPGQEVIVTAIPLYHIFALMVNFITYFSVGAENWLVANPRDMDGFVEIFKLARPTVFMGVNTLYAGLTQHPRLKDVDFSRLRLAGGGGAKIQPTTSERWAAITGQFIREGYGLSETSPVLTFNPASTTSFSGTAGLPLPSTDIKLLDDNGQEVAPGEAGEVCATGPQVMRGYWNQPEANAAAFTSDGYFRTGDIGQLDEDGFLRIVDRKKDMIIVSGFNVYPNEIEAVAAAMPGVLECACVGAPDDKTGEAVKLFVVAAPGSGMTEADVREFCRGQLTAYKVPKLVRLIDALPKSAVGKILRRELRDVA